jgi:SAM-dependent methyltransferase
MKYCDVMHQYKVINMILQDVKFFPQTVKQMSEKLCYLSTTLGWDLRALKDVIELSVYGYGDFTFDRLYCMYLYKKKDFISRSVLTKSLSEKQFIVKICSAFTSLKIAMKRRFNRLHPFGKKVLNRELLTKPNLGIVYKSMLEVVSKFVQDFTYDIEIKPVVDKSSPLYVDNIPKHLTTYNWIDYLKQPSCFLSVKADGVTRLGVISAIPSVTLIGEWMEEENLFLVFDIYDSQQKFTLQDLAKYHSFHKSMQINKMTTSDTVGEMIEQEKLSLQRYLSTTKDPQKVNWWIKAVWKCGTLDFPKIASRVADVGYKTDGWILSSPSHSFNKIKIKPIHELTADLTWDGKSNQATDRDCVIYDITHSGSTAKSGIWRMVWNYEANKWSPRDFRSDKRHANTSDIVGEITYQHTRKLNIIDTIADSIQDLKTVEYYYQDNVWSYQPFTMQQLCYQVHDHTCKKIVDTFVSSATELSVLDVGCGHGAFQSKIINAFYKTNKACDFDFYNMDHDIVALSQLPGDHCFPEDLMKYKDRSILADFSLPWTQEEQIKFTPFTRLNHWDTFHDKLFDRIVLCNSIHYGNKSPEGWNTVWENIVSKLKTGGMVFIQYFDIDDDFKSSSIPGMKYYVDKNSWYQITPDKTHLQYIYEWTHKKPITEPIINKKMIHHKVEQYGFEIILEGACKDGFIPTANKYNKVVSNSKYTPTINKWMSTMKYIIIKKISD